MAPPAGAKGSLARYALAALGILGGAVLLAAFVLDIPPNLNDLRLMLFNVGAIAIVVGVYRRQAAVDPGLALLGAVPAILANAWHFAMVVLAMGRPEPFAGDFGLVFFWAALAMWLADACFGLVAMRLGVAWRWAALALAIGSVLAITGMDRLELTSPKNPTIFGPIALTGVALNGLAWILLGLDQLRGDRTPRITRG